MREGWVETNLGSLLRLGRSGIWGNDTPESGDIEVTCLRGTDIADLLSKAPLNPPSRFIPKSKLDGRECVHGMVLIETSGSKCGRSIMLTDELLEMIGRPVTYSNFCRVLEFVSERLGRRFADIWFGWMYDNGELPSWRATSAMPNLDIKGFLQFQSILVPPLAEQRRIVDVIGAVDAYVAALESYATAARTARAALLHELLTTNTEGWKETTLGELCSITKGTSPTEKTPPGAFPLVVTAAARRSSSAFQFDGPAVCIPTVSSTGHGHASLKRVHYQDGQFALANIMLALQVSKPEFADTKFLWFLLNHQRGQLLVPLMRGTANMSFGIKDLSIVKLLLPPLAEQQRIVAVIESVDGATAGADRAAEDACNLRSGLLSDLLSGDHEIPAGYDELLAAA